MNYTFAELHFHTKESSPCAQIGAVEAVNIYHDNGYDLICVTDHYSRSDLGRLISHEASWEEIMDRYMLGYHLAKKEAEKYGMTVLKAAEIAFDSSPNEYLVYGITEEMFYELPKLYKLTVEEFSDFARKNNFFFAQAHPFRKDYMTRTDPSLLDGTEVHNIHDEDKMSARLWAKENGLVPMCGQDFHEYAAMQGVKTAFHGEVRDIKTLTEKLFNREFDMMFPQKHIFWVDM